MGGGSGGGFGGTRGSVPKYPGNDPKKAPKGYTWRGPGEKGSKKGSYHNPDDGTVLRPDLDHPKPIKPHWDYKDILGKWWRIFRDGSIEPKI